MAGRRDRRLVLVLSAEQYDELDRRARAVERDAWQQARWYVLRALDRCDTDEPEDTDRAETRAS